ncbi:TetR/AcrR family transcriptional regulator [bacterium]|nr:TetR/AcrR family transcriptional regulator [bacterium]
MNKQKQKRTNAASARTRKLIEDTFVEILHEKGRVDLVNVTELVKRAQICRSTFYKHFPNVKAVVLAIKEELVQEFCQNAQSAANKTAGEVYFDKIYQFVKRNDKFFRLILNTDDSVMMVIDMSKIYKDSFCKLLKTDKEIVNRKLLDVEVSTLCDGCALQIIRYYRGETKASLKEIITSAKMSYENLHRWRSHEPTK